IWIPLTEPPNLEPENHTTYPAPGDVVFDLGHHKSPEILIAYGPVRLASRAGEISANHFATIDNERDTLRELGRLTHWHGAQDVPVRALSCRLPKPSRSARAASPATSTRSRASPDDAAVAAGVVLRAIQRLVADAGAR